MPELNPQPFGIYNIPYGGPRSRVGFGPFGLSDLSNMTVNQLGHVRNMIETPAHIYQGELSPEYMRALTGFSGYQNIPVGAINANSDDDELLDPPAFRRSVDWSDVYRLSGVEGLVNSAEDAVDRASYNFHKWLNNGPDKGIGKVVRDATKNAMRSGDEVAAIMQGQGGVGTVIPLPGNTVTAADAAPPDIQGPADFLPPGVTLEEHLGLVPKPASKPQTPSGRSMSQGDPNFDGPLPVDAPFDMNSSDFSPVGGFGFDDALPEGFVPPSVQGAAKVDAAADSAADEVKKAATKAKTGDAGWADALISLGAGMAASKQTNFAGAAGEGLLLGLKSLKDTASAAQKDRLVTVEERKADAATVSAAASLLKAREDKKPTKAKEFEYLRNLGWSEEEAAKGAKLLNDLDDDILKIVVAESVRAQAMGLGELTPDTMVKMIQNVKNAKAQLSSTGQTAPKGGTVKRTVVRGADGKLTYSN